MAINVWSGERSWSATVRDYISLMKPRIIVLLLVPTLAAMLIAARQTVPPKPLWLLVVATLIGGTLASGGAGAINQFLDRDIDGIMQRTKRRPIPSGRISANNALIFGVAISAASGLLLWLVVNPLSAGLALGGNLYYVFVYTRWLKRATPQNIVIGGAAGAVPPLVGWAAVTGGLSLPAVLLFAIVFCWTPPHFWALSLFTKEDYRRAGVPMLPVVVGPQQTCRSILSYTLILVACTLLLWLTHTLGLIYLIAAIGLGCWFVVLSVRLMRDRRMARPLFLYSLVYLALLYGAMVVDRIFPI